MTTQRIYFALLTAISRSTCNYYDSIVMSSPVMPDSYLVYQKKTDESSTIEQFTSQWGSYFFEKSDFPISLKGYKSGEIIYEYYVNQVMRERDFLGIDWTNGNITIANPKTNCVYCILDSRYEFLLTDTQLRNNTGYVEIKMPSSPELTEVENLQRKVTGLKWLLKKHLGEKSAQNATDFKTLPEDEEIMETYENVTTRAALLHRKEDDLHTECYYVIAEAK